MGTFTFKVGDLRRKQFIPVCIVCELSYARWLANQEKAWFGIWTDGWSKVWV